MMNLIEINRLVECRKRLDRIQPICPKELAELAMVKETLDDLLEFKVFPSYPGFTD